ARVLASNRRSRRAHVHLPGMPRRAATGAVRVARKEVLPVGLEDALDLLVSSPPFERLLLARERPIVARADAGEDFLIAGLAGGLETAVLAVTGGPHEAESLASGIEAYLGADRVGRLAAWEALPYEGISPSPAGAARRHEGIRRLRAAAG